MSVAQPAIRLKPPLFPAGLDFAFCEFAPELIGFDDETPTINARKFGEIDLLRAAAANEHLVTFIGIGRPGAGQFHGTGAFGQHERHDHRCAQSHSSNTCHRSFP